MLSTNWLFGSFPRLLPELKAWIAKSWLHMAPNSIIRHSAATRNNNETLISKMPPHFHVPNTYLECSFFAFLDFSALEK